MAWFGNEWPAWVSNLANLIQILGIPSLLFSIVRDRRERQRMRRRVKILLKTETGTYTLPGTLRREDLRRGEVLGHLGMVPLKGEQKRFEPLSYLNTGSFFDQMYQIYKDDGDAELILYASHEELEQFEIELVPA